MNSLLENANEMWLPIPGFEEYLVSNLGRVFSKITNRVLRPGKDGGGYLKVVLSKDGVVYTKLVHRLVLEAFCPIEDSTLEANHVNGNKVDNRLVNLEWSTHSENMRHSVHSLKNNHGSNRKSVGQFTRDGKLIAEYRSAMEAERATGVHNGNICKCAKGRLNHAGGYVWRYINDANLSNAA